MWILVVIPYLVIATANWKGLRKASWRDRAIWGGMLGVGLLLALAYQLEWQIPSPLRVLARVLGMS